MMASGREAAHAGVMELPLEARESYGFQAAISRRGSGSPALRRLSADRRARVDVQSSSRRSSLTKEELAATAGQGALQGSPFRLASSISSFARAKSETNLDVMMMCDEAAHLALEGASGTEAVALRKVFSELKAKISGVLDQLEEPHNAEKRNTLRGQQAKLDTARKSFQVSIESSKTVLEGQKQAALQRQATDLLLSFSQEKARVEEEAAARLESLQKKLLIEESKTNIERKKATKAEARLKELQHAAFEALGDPPIDLASALDVLREKVREELQAMQNEFSEDRIKEFVSLEMNKLFRAAGLEVQG